MEFFRDPSTGTLTLINSLYNSQGTAGISDLSVSATVRCSSR